jgi:hypothetical protein
MSAHRAIGHEVVVALVPASAGTTPGVRAG